MNRLLYKPERIRKSRMPQRTLGSLVSETLRPRVTKRPRQGTKRWLPSMVRRNGRVIQRPLIPSFRPEKKPVPLRATRHRLSKGKGLIRKIKKWWMERPVRVSKRQNLRLRSKKSNRLRKPNNSPRSTMPLPHWRRRSPKSRKTRKP